MWFRRLAAVFLFLTCGTAGACLNEYGRTLSGESKLMSHADIPHGHKVDIARVTEKADELRAAFEQDQRFEDASDLAIRLLRLGEIDEAIELLQWAEANSEDEYQIATNLGTAYELAGRNEDALKWIRIGLERNPESHGGSEWLHENLLKAKIAMASDPDWLESNSVTGLNFGDGDLPAYDREASFPNCPELVDEIARHLYIQLNERRSFIPGPDPIVAAMMFDLANAYAIDGTVEDATPVFTLARELRFHDPVFLDRRLSALSRIDVPKATTTGFRFSPRWLTFGFIVVAVIALWIVFRILLTSRPMPVE
ncbi:MAG: tetratricopeptide repeat protein [Planctomycetota bacterium]